MNAENKRMLRAFLILLAVAVVQFWISCWFFTSEGNQRHYYACKCRQIFGRLLPATTPLDRR